MVAKNTAVLVAALGIFLYQMAVANSKNEEWAIKKLATVNAWFIENFEIIDDEDKLVAEMKKSGEYGAVLLPFTPLINKGRNIADLIFQSRGYSSRVVLIEAISQEDINYQYWISFIRSGRGVPRFSDTQFAIYKKKKGAAQKSLLFLDQKAILQFADEGVEIFDINFEYEVQEHNLHSWIE